MMPTFFRIQIPGVRTVLTLDVLKGLNYQLIPWKDAILNIPLFRGLVQTARDFATSVDTALSYKKYYEWIKRLEEETGFI